MSMVNMDILTKMASEYKEDDIVVEPPPVDSGRKVTILLTPQYRDMNQDQKEVVRDYQESGFPVDANNKTGGEHTSTPSHDDARTPGHPVKLDVPVRMVVAGNGTAYPDGRLRPERPEGANRGPTQIVVEFTEIGSMLGTQPAEPDRGR